MQKSFRLISDAGVITMPANDAEEAKAKARRALPSIKEITSVEQMSDLEIAESEINDLEHQIYMMGANDYELPAIAQIRASLRAGQTSPDDAVAQASRILASKMDYH